MCMVIHMGGYIATAREQCAPMPSRAVRFILKRQKYARV